MQKLPLNKLAIMALTMPLLFHGVIGIDSKSHIDPENSEQQVVGGTDATIFDYPWMGALVRTSSEDNTRQFCGCTAISPYFVLTAGHCVDDSITPENFKIVFGTADLENEATAQVFFPKTILIHPDYINSYTKDNDIALIQLREPLPDSIPKVPLASDPSLELPGVTARLLGWGLTNTDFRNREDTLVLQQADLSIVTQEFANLPEYYEGIVHENMIAAGNFEPYNSSGSGDSGGPLLSFNQELNRWEQIGISNFGAGCDKPENPISAYARVSTHLDWINNLLQNDFLSWAKEYDLPDLIYNEGDDHSPLMEYILGLDPTVIDHPQTGLVRTISHQESQILGKLRLRNSVPPINVRREWSGDLNDWNVAELNHDRITKENIEGSNLSLYNIPVNTSGNNTGFYRIGHEDNRGIIHGPHTIRVGSRVKGLFNQGIEAYGLTHYDYLIDTMDSPRTIRITAESDIDQAFSIKVVELESGKQILAWSESGHPDSPSYPFNDVFWPLEGKQYLLRISSNNWTVPQGFEVRLDHVGDVVDLSLASPYVGNLTPDDHSYKRRNHFADDYIVELAANTTFKVEVRSEELDQLIFIQDANTGELIHEIDQKATGETEAVLVQFEKNKLLRVTVTSYEKNATGEYVIEVGGFSEWSTLKPGEKTIGFIKKTDPTVESNGNTFYVKEIDLKDVEHPDGVTIRVRGYDTFYPSYGIYNLTTGKRIHGTTARCNDRSFHFKAVPGNNYRLVIFAPTSRLDENLEIELLNGDVGYESSDSSAITVSKAEQEPVYHSYIEWKYLNERHEN